jgi:hypothetical protein
MRHRELPIGWVLENDGGTIVGTFSNIPIAYTYRQTPLVAAVASAWACDEAWRPSSMELICRFFAQKNVDFFLDTTANDVAAKIMKAFGARQVSAAACDEVLFWITNYNGAVASLLRRKAIPAAGLVSPVAGTALRLVDWWKNRGRPCPVSGRVNILDDFDERFDGFWNAIQSSSEKLLAVRDRATLRWHFQFSLSRGTATLLALEDQGQLAGYAVLIRQDEPTSRLRRLRVADLQVLNNEPAHVETLLGQALKYAEKQRIHIVEVIGQEASKRSVLKRFSPRQRALPAWAYWCKSTNRNIRGELYEPPTWDASPYDGDASLFTFNLEAA